jgi:hypothetical protein
VQHVIVVGDIHTQAEKFWRILRESGCADDALEPATRLVERDDTRLVLLGDLVHAKSRQRYADLVNVRRYDEYNPRHLKAAEQAQEAFLYDVRASKRRSPRDA